MSASIEWTTRTLPHTDIPVGPCAWRLSMPAGDDLAYVKSHPSLIVVGPHDDDSLLERVGGGLQGLPILLGVAEPPFARNLQGEVLRRMSLLDRDRVDALVVHIEDPAEVKSGGLLQTMFSLRDRGIVGWLGLAHPDPRVVEWLSQNAAVRLLGVNYSLENQAAACRALASAGEYGMSVFGLTSPRDEAAIRFALGQADGVLPVLDRPIPTGLTRMTAWELDNAWNGYKQQHPPPAALERGLPPVVDA